jgi:hypothetical protein
MSDISEEAEEGYKLYEKDDPYIPRLVAEIKRLQSCCEKYGEKVMRQETNMLKVIARNREQRKQLTAKDIELARWQQIAIDATAKASTYRSVAVSLGYPEKCHAVPASGDLVRATGELNLQATQDAGYVDRLEKEFLDVYPYAEIGWSMHGYPIEFSEEERQTAQAALIKIREGKP